MTSNVYPCPVRLPWTHRIALRFGRALTAWAGRPVRHHPSWSYAERVDRFEQARDQAMRTLPQLRH
jgi:hypothetical protein